MYTSPLVTMQPIRWALLLFGLIMFVWSSVFRFIHHKPKNRGYMLTTNNVHFMKLSKYVTVFIIAFLSSRWSKKHIWNVQFGVWMRELCIRENVWTTGTTGPRSPVLPVREGLAQIWTTGTTGLRLVLPMDGGRWCSLAWKWTTGGAWPKVPVGVYSESNFQISNRFFSRLVFGRGKLRK
jgi:hypothetical protein